MEKFNMSARLRVGRLRVPILGCLKNRQKAELMHQNVTA